MTPGKRTMGWRLFAIEKKDAVSWSLVRRTRDRSDRLRIVTNQLSRPGSYVVNQQFTKSLGIVLGSAETRFHWWH
jgi:hypothetical protein